MSILDSITGKSQPDIHAAAPIPERLRKAERVLIITADNTEDTEFFYPYYRLTEDGYQVDVATPDGGAFKAKHGLGLQDTLSINDIRPQDYALIYIPGGKAPETLRKDDAVLSFVKTFAQSGKPIAAVCHGPQLLIAADLVRGKQMACWPEVREELEKAGGIFVNEALVEDGQFITARMPGDLHRHLYGVLQYLRGKQQAQPRDQRKSAA